MARHLAQKPIGHAAIVARRDGEILGCVLTQRVDDSVYLGRVAVLPAARGHDLARHMVTRVAEEARAAGVPALTLSVRLSLPRNRHLFESLGFEAIGTEAHAGFDHPTTLLMRRRLRGA
ncbi:MAG TPA: GNAT family N-acetyltransferase [Stellaceae bacterium]|nr:GNAT family N-acetyltransferase [Stellaceae bacterium]